MMRFLGWAFYAIACCACLVYVSFPLSMLTVGAGLVAGLVAVLVTMAVILADSGRTVVLAPGDPRLALLGRVAREYVRRDLAWPHYFAAQVVFDARSMIIMGWVCASRMWKSTMDWLRVRGYGGFWWPISLVPLVAGLSGASLGAATGMTVVLLIVAVLTAAVWLVGVPVVYALRAVDAAWRLIRQSGASCTYCYAVSKVPAYRCLGPHSAGERQAGDDLHRDLRPGRLGVITRRCACSRQLPTMVLRAAFSRRLEACCPSCGERLGAGAGAFRDVRVPVFGPASAGKTQFIMSALVGLHAAAQRSGVTVTLPDRQGQETYAIYADLVARRAAAPKTDTSAPVAVTVRIEQGVKTTVVHLYDAAGEILTDREENARLAYLDHAEALTFVLDPFSIERVRDEYQSSFREVFTSANAALHHPEDAYNATVQRLQEFGVRTARRRLAFVVSKADLLGQMPMPLPGRESAAIRGWLAGLGLDNLLLSAERDFREVRYFLVSGRDTGPDGPTATLRWLVDKGWGNIA